MAISPARQPHPHCRQTDSRQQPKAKQPAAKQTNSKRHSHQPMVKCTQSDSDLVGTTLAAVT